MLTGGRPVGAQPPPYPPSASSTNSSANSTANNSNSNTNNSNSSIFLPHSSSVGKSKSKGTSGSGSGSSISKYENSNNNTNVKQPKISFSILCTIIVMAAICFLGGTFVGSKFVHKLEPGSNSFLPGSVTIVNKMEQRLRGPSFTSAIPNTIPSLSSLSLSSSISSTSTSTSTANTKTTTDTTSSSFSSNEATTPSSNLNEHVSKDEKFDVETSLVNSMYASRSSFMIGPEDLDSYNLIVGVWVRMDSGANANDMRTIFTNKQSGCDNTAERNGFSLYVNEWQTSNKKLYLEYGGDSSGCNKVNSGDITLLEDRWYHLACAFQGPDVYLYIDGSIVAHDNTKEKHAVQQMSKMVVGTYANREYPFQGNISHFTVIRIGEAVSEEEITKNINDLKDDPRNALKISETFAYFPLLDSESSTGTAVDLKRKDEASSQGRYQIVAKKGKKQVGVDFPLVDGLPLRNAAIPQSELDHSDSLARDHREVIKKKTAALWSNYRKYAWGYDELKPISGRGDNNWGGMAVTLVDSLDTLFLMGLQTEFDEARDYVKSQLSFGSANTVSVFETTIRELGGLLAAYDLSGEKCFLDRALELGNLLLPAFETSSGIPRSMVNFQSRSASNGWAGNVAILSELGSLQIEFRRLAVLTGRPDIEEKVMKVLHRMSTIHPEYGLFPIKVDIQSGAFADSQITFGALGDSFYEYLLKLWLQTGKKETWLRTMYDDAMDGAIEKLLLPTEPSGLAFLSDFNGNSNNRKMDHLVCFMPGLLALGAANDPKGPNSERAKRDLAVAKALMYTCREMYHRMPSGISAEYVEFPRGTGGDISVPNHVAFYILRPETAESLFILHQVTKDPIYREWAWEIFTAIDRHCKAEHGYGALRDVRNPDRGVDDRMESFFIAETLKYLYLVQDPDTIIDLTKYVFNTEAHPTKIYEKS